MRFWIALDIIGRFLRTSKMTGFDAMHTAELEAKHILIIFRILKEIICVS
jgi:hypothetical protein